MLKVQFITRNALITDKFTDEKLKKYVSVNFTDGLTDVKNSLVNDASVIKKINNTDGKFIRW